jgi:hypothetical protein
MTEVSSGFGGLSGLSRTGVKLLPATERFLVFVVVISTGECNRFTHSPEVTWDDGEEE